MFSIGHRNKQLKAAAPKMAFSATSLHESKERTTEEAVQRLSWKNTDLTVSERAGFAQKMRWLYRLEGTCLLQVIKTEIGEHFLVTEPLMESRMGISHAQLQCETDRWFDSFSPPVSEATV